MGCFVVPSYIILFSYDQALENKHSHWLMPCAQRWPMASQALRT